MRASSEDDLSELIHIKLSPYDSSTRKISRSHLEWEAVEEFTTYYIYLRLGKGIFDGHQIIGHAGMFGVQPIKLSIRKPQLKTCWRVMMEKLLDCF